MALKRPPNPNTAYGRRRLREEYPQRLQQMTPMEREQHESDITLMNVILWVFALVSCFIAYIFFGGDGLLDG